MELELELEMHPPVELVKPEKLHAKEKWYVLLIQILVPSIIAGFGQIGAGLLLDYVQVCKKIIIRICMVESNYEI